MSKKFRSTVKLKKSPKSAKKRAEAESSGPSGPNRAARRAALREAYAAAQEALKTSQGEGTPSESAEQEVEVKAVPHPKTKAGAPFKEPASAETPAPPAPQKREIEAENKPEESPESNEPTETGGFDVFGLSPKVVQAISDLGFEAPTPIQSQAIPVLLEGGDLIGQAQTGTGKTAAFALPIIQNIDVGNPITQAIILAPTRELAVQVAGGVHDLAKNTGIRVVPVYGGQPIDRQFRALRMGAHIVVGTPGRVIDHLRRGSLSLENVNFCVLDEADEMLALGFLEEVEEILAALPAKRQMAFFSATMPPKIKSLTKRFLNNPQHIAIDAKQRTVESVGQTYYEIPRGKKPETLARVLDMEAPGPTIVFCRTRLETNELAEALRLRGYSAEALNGEMSQNDRDRVLRRFKGGQADLLVATDVAARGLDIETVTHVINYDIPWDVEQYIHRIGRTGRAGRSGNAITLVGINERRRLKFIEQMTGVKMKLERIPTSADIAARRRDVFKDALCEVLRSDEYESELETVADLSEEFGTADIAAAALHMLWKNQHQVESSAADFAADHEQPETGMTRIFIGLGKQDGLRPGELVATIAGKCDIPGKSIGTIDIMDRSTFVEVPSDISNKVIEVLKRVRLRGKNPSVDVARPRR